MTPDPPPENPGDQASPWPAAGAFMVTLALGTAANGISADAP
ncbi:hypothetical protein [Actinoplanes rectilineatus]|nr:hypothetical protein [Actinoplanes rectilineatus]